MCEGALGCIIFAQGPERANQQAVTRASEREGAKKTRGFSLSFLLVLLHHLSEKKLLSCCATRIKTPLLCSSRAVQSTAVQYRNFLTRLLVLGESSSSGYRLPVVSDEKSSRHDGGLVERRET